MDHQQEVRGLKAQELTRGERPDGSVIGFYHNTSYSRFKERKNPLAKGNVDLILTGSFIDSAHLVNKETNKYTINFADSKSGKLIAKYGQDIKGLNQDAFNSFLKVVIREDYVKSIKKYARIQ